MSQSGTSINNSGTSDPQVTERQVSAACGRIEAAQALQSKFLEELGIRLQGVVRIEPMGGIKEEQDPQTLVPLATLIQGYAVRMEQNNLIIESLLNRLELP